ncbi:MAG: elongation factor G [Kiritimatiellae bacterium]|nr:elongation factor G [Kiritimatiellia bacterium]
MKDIPVDKVRNVALLGHTGSGKTTLLDALLFRLGLNDRKGQPDNGTSAADWTDEEKDRKMTVWSKPFELRRAGAGGVERFVVLDTPGYADFVGQMICAASVADAALVVVDAVAGVQVGTVRAWRLCEQLGLPRGIVITGLDRDNANAGAVLAAIQSAWGSRCLPVTLPTADLSTVVRADDPGAQGEAEAARARLMEAAAEADDALLEKYLGGEPLSEQDVAVGLRRAVAAGSFVPVFAVCARTDAGLAELLDGLARYFPSPLDRPRPASDGSPVDPSPDAPFVGQVWRTIADPFAGQLSLCRVFGGTLRADSEVVNLAQGSRERIGSLLLLNGRKQEMVPEAHAGDVIALAKLKSTRFNDTLAAVPSQPALRPISVPNPVMAYAVAPKTQGDDDKLMAGLQRVAEEDPTLRLERNPDTHQLILSGMGDTQINVAVEKMRRHNRLEVVLSPPKIAYRETVTGRGEGHYKHKKQTGGRGQYAEVYLRLQPLPPGDNEWFVDAIVGGAIPGNFLPAVQKGLLEAMSAGPLAGAPVVNVKVTVYDGSYHEVDSSEIAFKIAAARAFKDGMLNSKPVLLEPIMKLRVIVPEQCMGDVTGDLNHRRGRILGMDTEDGMQVVTAEVPQAELFQYSSQLRSMTGGRGTFEMEFSRLEIVPSNIAQRVIAEAQKARQPEEE